MLPLYIHRNSPVHSVAAGYKILLVIVGSAGVVLIASPLLLAALLAGIAALYPLARLPLKTVALALKPVFLIAAIIFGLQLALAGWIEAAASLLRILALVLLASLATLTTKLSDMLETLTRAARPASVLGLSPPKLALAIGLTIRFIPALLHDWQEIQRARVARGARAFSFLGAGPLIVKILRMTDALGEAIAARSFDNRT